MIVVNIEKARAIAQERAKQIKDEVQRAALLDAIAKAADLVQLRAIMDGLPN